MSFSNYYQEPLWDIGPEDWNRSLSNPGLIGECYSLDISSRINPAELFMLNLVKHFLLHIRCETYIHNGLMWAH